MSSRGQTLRRTGPQMKRSGGAIAPVVLTKKKVLRWVTLSLPSWIAIRTAANSCSTDSGNLSFLNNTLTLLAKTPQTASRKSVKATTLIPAGIRGFRASIIVATRIPPLRPTDCAPGVEPSKNAGRPAASRLRDQSPLHASVQPSEDCYNDRRNQVVWTRKPCGHAASPREGLL